jgi:hypothetical protein
MYPAKTSHAPKRPCCALLPLLRRLLPGTTTAANSGKPPKPGPKLPHATTSAPSAEWQRARSAGAGPLPHPASTEVDRGKKTAAHRRTPNLLNAQAPRATRPTTNT